MVKLGTLYPDGRLDDLGEVNGGLKPGADSARRAEEYGWYTHYEDTGAFYAGKQVEDTSELKYMFGIEVTDLGDACGDQRTLFFSELIEDGTRKFESKDAVYEAFRGFPDLKERLEEWNDDGEEVDVANDVEVLIDWADYNMAEVDESLMVTTLLVVPVSLPGSKVREACGSAEHFEMHSLPAFKEHGDWRCDVWSLAMYGAKVPIQSCESWVEDGEYPTEDIEVLKQASLQVKMMFGVFMDKQVNVAGETGWDWMRNVGVIFDGDPVVRKGHEGLWLIQEKLSSEDLQDMLIELTSDGKRFAKIGGRLVWEGEGDFPACLPSYRITDLEDENDVIVPATEVRGLDFWERLHHAQSTSSEEG